MNMNGAGRGGGMMPYQMGNTYGQPQYGNQARGNQMSQPGGMYGMAQSNMMNAAQPPVNQYMYGQYGQSQYQYPYQMSYPYNNYQQPYQSQHSAQVAPPPPPPQNVYSSSGATSQYASVQPVSTPVASVPAAGQGYNNELNEPNLPADNSTQASGSVDAEENASIISNEQDNSATSQPATNQPGENKSFNFSDFKSLLTAFNRKEGWEKYLNDEDRQCVENILSEAVVFDSQYANFEKEFTKMHTATSMLGDSSLKVYNSMWTEWKNKLLSRREQTTKLQEQTLDRLYKKVCQNFPLFLTRDLDLLDPTPKLKNEPLVSRPLPTSTLSSYQKPNLNSNHPNVAPNVPAKGPQVPPKPQPLPSKQPPAPKVSSSPDPDSFAASEMGKVKAIVNNDNFIDAWSRESLGDIEFQRANNDFSFLRNQMKFVNNLLFLHRSKPAKKLPNVSSVDHGSSNSTLSNPAVSNLVKNALEQKVVPPSRSLHQQNTASANLFVSQIKDSMPKSNPNPVAIQKPQLFESRAPEPIPAVIVNKLENIVPLSIPTLSPEPTKPIAPMFRPIAASNNIPPSFPSTTSSSKPIPKLVPIPIIPQSIRIASSSNSKYSGLEGLTSIPLASSPPNAPPISAPPVSVPAVSKPPVEPIFPTNNGLSIRPPIAPVAPKSISINIKATQKPPISKETEKGTEKVKTKETIKEIKKEPVKSAVKEIVKPKEAKGKTDENVKENIKEKIEKKPSSSSNETLVKKPEEQTNCKQIPTLVKKRAPVPPKVLPGVTEANSAGQFKSTYYESQFNQPGPQDIGLFLERERSNLQEKPSYMDTRFYTVPRKYTEEPLYIKDLLEPPARAFRPPRIAFIIRGLPGSGKSHLARMIKEREERFGSSAGIRLLSLDDYFVVEKEDQNEDMEYVYDPLKEPEYKLNLFKAFRKTLVSNFYDFVILDSVNSSISEVREFYASAIESGFIPYVVEMEAIVRRILNDCFDGEEIVAYCYKHNKHGRSLSEIRTLYESWELLPVEYLRADAYSMLASEGSDSTSGGVKSDSFSTGDNRSQHSDPATGSTVLSTYNDYDTKQARLGQTGSMGPGHSSQNYSTEYALKSALPDSYTREHRARSSPQPQDDYHYRTKRSRFDEVDDRMDYSQRSREGNEAKSERSRDSYGFSSDYYERRNY